MNKHLTCQDGSLTQHTRLPECFPFFFRDCIPYLEPPCYKIFYKMQVKYILRKKRWPGGIWQIKIATNLWWEIKLTRVRKVQGPKLICKFCNRPLRQEHLLIIVQVTVQRAITSIFHIQRSGQSSGPAAMRYRPSGLHDRNDTPYVCPSKDFLQK